MQQLCPKLIGRAQIPHMYKVHRILSIILFGSLLKSQGLDVVAVFLFGSFIDQGRPLYDLLCITLGKIKVKLKLIVVKFGALVWKTLERERERLLNKWLRRSFR